MKGRNLALPETLGMLVLLTSCVPAAPAGEAAAPASGERWDEWVHVDEARIAAEGAGSTLALVVPDMDRYRLPDGRLLISVELPKSMGRPEIQPMLRSFSFAARHATDRGLDVPMQRLDVRDFQVNFPPGPDTATTWHVFALPRSAQLSDDPVEVLLRLGVPVDRVDFARVLLGLPSTPNSRVLGAFSAAGRRATERVVEAGEDYLGTVAAMQHIRIPAGVLRQDAEAFDGMVEFTEAPFDSTRSNVDTEMLRTRRVSVGGTVPVRLVRFANRSLHPIRVASRSGDTLLYSITARLSPNAESGGFITIRPDGSYASTTTLFPVLEIQQVSAAGEPVGTPVIIDTALTPVPGFPFYLASNGGQWLSRPPEGRLVTAESSNFFYAKDMNQFFHSNGPGPGILGKCTKSSGFALQEIAGGR